MTKLEGILRYLLIIRRIQRGDYPTKDQLIDFVNSELPAHIDTSNKGYSSRTFERDLKDIRDSLGVSIESKCLGKKLKKNIWGYGIVKDKYEVDDPDRFEAILEPFYILNSIQADTGLQKVVYPEKHYPKGLEHLYPLIKAAKEHRKVEFVYTKYHLAPPGNKDGKPLRLKAGTGQMVPDGV